MGAAVLAVNQVKVARVIEDAGPGPRGTRVDAARGRGICWDGRSGRLGRAVVSYKVKVEGGA